MKKIVTFAAIISLVSLMACGGIDSPASDPSIIPADQASALADSNSVITNMDNIIQPQDGNIQTLNAPPGAIKTITMPAATKTAAGMNPAHGSPGHRCEIAVGAPLNSSPAAVTTTQPQVQTITAPAATQTVPVQSAIPGATGKINPAHGEPGHDCSVAVGAALKN